VSGRRLVSGRVHPRGFALVLSMLLVLALAVLGMGMLAVANGEQAVAGALSRKARAVRQAEAAALEAVRAWSTHSMSDMGVGERRPLDTGDVDGAAWAERIDSALFLVRGEGSVPGPGEGATAAAGLLVRVLHPRTLARGFPGALNVPGPADITGTVLGSGGCGGAGPGVVSPTVRIEAGALVDGNPPVRYETPPPVPAPDPMAPPVANALADLRHTGFTAEPRPMAAGGACVPGDRNWGSTDPSHPCHALLPMVVTSDLDLTGGVGRGVLVVAGDLFVTGETELEGIIVVLGHLTLDAGSAIRGTARAGSARIEGRVMRDDCAVAAALSAPSLDRGFRPAPRWWIPLF
jgi:Na+-transporting methylmalonyl-CoA/oxaloacetate decarboxylase gamma subunit